MSKPKITTGYMVHGSTALAPYFGWQRTRKGLIAEVQKRGFFVRDPMRIVKVEIREIPSKRERP